MLGIGLIVSLKTKRSLDSDNRSMMESIQIINIIIIKYKEERESVM